MTHNALITAAVVSYGRMFVSSRGSADTLPALLDRFLKQLTANQRALHHRLIDLRNKEFAHSDNGVAQVSLLPRRIFASAPLMPVSNLLRADSVSEEELRGMNDLLEQVYIFVFDARERLDPYLAANGGL